MTVAELEARMSSREFSDWFQFFEMRNWYHDPKNADLAGVV